MMSDALVWIHGADLNPHSPALTAHPDAPRVFIFDDVVIERYQLSLKRIAFIYECLLEIPRVEIRKGELVAELVEAAREHRCQRIVTTASVAPRFARLCARLKREYALPVEVMPLEPFVELTSSESARLDLKRFSRYWNPLKAKALSLNQSFDW
jgi:hypothetical protein